MVYLLNPTLRKSLPASPVLSFSSPPQAVAYLAPLFRPRFYQISLSRLFSFSIFAPPGIAFSTIQLCWCLDPPPLPSLHLPTCLVFLTTPLLFQSVPVSHLLGTPRSCAPPPFAVYFIQRFVDFGFAFFPSCTLFDVVLFARFSFSGFSPPLPPYVQAGDSLFFRIRFPLSAFLSRLC